MGDGLTNQCRESKKVETCAFAGDFKKTTLVDLQGRTLAWVGFPASWTTAALTVFTIITDTAHADVTAALCVNPVKDKRTNTYWNIPSGIIVKDEVVIIPIGELVGLRYLVFQSGTHALAVAQASALEIAYGTV